MPPTTITIDVHAPIEKVWQYWNEPEHIVQWAFASNDWECPKAENDLKVGGVFTTTMSAKDKSVTFDITGTYTDVALHKSIAYTMVDGRKVQILFNVIEQGVEIIETFDPENENPVEMQQAGWQAILNNFKKHVEQG